MSNCGCVQRKVVDGLRLCLRVFAAVVAAVHEVIVMAVVAGSFHEVARRILRAAGVRSGCTMQI